MAGNSRQLAPWQLWLHEIIFEADTPGGRLFDVFLFVAIVVSVIAVSLESVTSIRIAWGPFLRALEWALTILFTVEYVMRLSCIGRPGRYAVSFFGIVDLLSILPTYLSLFFVGTQSMLVIRALRLLRIFRVFKLARFLREADVLSGALRASLRKIIVFLGTVLTLVLILGTSMYLIEGEESGFTSIPQGVYWAIVTMTTVGYGDVTPSTVPGKILASFVMIVGYAIIAVPTGIVTVELGLAQQRRQPTTQVCPQCAGEGHLPGSRFCKDCGAML